VAFLGNVSDGCWLTLAPWRGADTQKVASDDPLGKGSWDTCRELPQFVANLSRIQLIRNCPRLVLSRLLGAAGAGMLTRV